MSLTKAQLDQRRNTLRQWINSPLGKEAMPILADMFDHDLKKKDPMDTYFALGQRDVVIMFRELQAAQEVIDVSDT